MQFHSDSEEDSYARAIIKRCLFLITLAHARNDCLFYKFKLKDLPDDISQIKLSQIPPTSRDELVSNHEDVVAANCKFAFASHTTGTTTGKFLEVYRSIEEQDFVSEYFSTLYSLRTHKITDPIPLILSFPIQHHGATMSLPTIGKLFIGGVSDDPLLEDSFRLLQNQYRIPGHDTHISILSGPIYQILFFTNFLHEQKYDFSKSNVTRIITFGQLITQREREFLESSWKVPIMDRYSLTEIFGGATYCSYCGGYHFDDFLIPEIIALNTKEVIDKGTGVLLLTALYPFTQMQPMIRYNTGDIFEILECPAKKNRIGYKLKGRCNNCIFYSYTDKRELVLASADYYSVLDDIPDIARTEWFSNVKSVKDRTPGSMMKFHVTTSQQDERLTITFDIELRYSPNLFLVRIREIENSIKMHLKKTNTFLTELDQGGKIALVFNFFGPNTFTKPFAQKI